MASKIPASFLANYVAQHGTNNRFAQVTAAPAPVTNAPPPPNTGTPPPPKPKTNNAPAPRPAKNNKPARPAARKKPGFFRGLAGAVAGEALKGTGHVGKHVVNKIRGVNEDEGGSGGMPVNNASSGAVAGLGKGTDEPGVKRGRKAPMLSYKLFKRSKGISK